MTSEKKYDLNAILAEIDDDVNEQSKDLIQHKDIPQDVITNLMMENLKKNIIKSNNTSANESTQNRKS